MLQFAVLLCHMAERVQEVVEMRSVLNQLDVVKRALGVDEVASLTAVGHSLRVYRLFVRAVRYEQAAIALVGGLQRQPAADERLRVSGDICSVLMPTETHKAIC